MIPSSVRPLAFGALCLLTACVNVEPIEAVDQHPVPAVAQKLTLDQIGKGIEEAGSRGKEVWHFHEQGPGHLTGIWVVGKYSAEIDLVYTPQAYNIHLVKSVNLRQSDHGIHTRYNRIVKALVGQIDDQLTKTAGQGG